MAEGTLVRWVKAEGQAVSKGEVLAEIETDKATVEVEALAEGVVRKHLIAENTTVPIGEPIAIIGSADEAIDIDQLIGRAAAKTPPEPTGKVPEVAVEALPGQATEAAGAHFPGGMRASPLARRLAEARGIDLASLSGSGPQGRIVKRDIERAAGVSAPQPATSPAKTALPPLTTERLEVSKLRSAIARRMTAAKQEIPHFYVTSEIDAGPLMALRQQLNELLAEDEKISPNDFIVKASALALRSFPNLNASLEGEQIVHHGEINIGVAVALEAGLMTVVVRNADLKPLREIAAELRQIVGRARQGKVRPDDVEGSTFTVSNLGMFGIDHFIAIVNPPEAAILAVGSVRQVPVIEDGRLVPGMRLKATLSADHRITDGAEAARWLQALTQLLEKPLQLVL
jgi:pyruvate dehydrogenase E2 component (dihydrolipoamide acetyltransferase)